MTKLDQMLGEIDQEIEKLEREEKVEHLKLAEEEGEQAQTLDVAGFSMDRQASRQAGRRLVDGKRGSSGPPDRPPPREARQMGHTLAVIFVRHMRQKWCC